MLWNENIFSIYSLGGGVCRVDSRSKCGKIFVVVVGVAHVWSLKAKAPLWMWPPSGTMILVTCNWVYIIQGGVQMRFSTFSGIWILCILWIKFVAAAATPRRLCQKLRCVRWLSTEPQQSDQGREREQEHNQTGREQIVIMKNNYTVRQQGGIKICFAKLVKNIDIF